MTTSDPESERHRLAALYASMTPQELEGILDDAASLTEPAWRALTAEMRRRGFAVPPVQPSGPGGDEAEERPLALIRRFRDLPTALLAKGSLESAGIDCFLADDNMVRMDWLYSNLLGGVKLLVDEANAAEASSLLDEPIPKTLEVEGVGEYEQPHCPRCQSLDVNFEELDKLAYLTFFVNLPIPFHKKGWSCHACGYQWQDEEEPAPQGGH